MTRRNTLSRRSLVTGIAVAAAAAALPVSASAAASSADPLLEWYDATASAVATGTRPQVTGSRAWAIGWLAAARALRGAPGRLTGNYQEAALASAVYTALTALIPAATPALDAQLSVTLARIPDGRAKESGIAAGHAEAQALLVQRTGDGLDPASVNPAYPTPGESAGIWQPTPPTFPAAQQAGTRFATPFLLDHADRYRPGPPPALGSRRYESDLAAAHILRNATRLFT